MPRTPEGKAKSARNATKHGVLSNEPLLVNENPACYEELLHAHIERFQPADEVELEIVHEMAFAKWRQRRAWNNETAMIDMQMHEEQEILKAKFEKFDEATRIAHAVGTLSDESSKLRANSRYETRFHRMYYRAMNQLLALQDRSGGPRESGTQRARTNPVLDGATGCVPDSAPPVANDRNGGHSGRKPNELLTGHVAVSLISTPPNAPIAPNDQNRGQSGRQPSESLTGEPAVSFSSPPNDAFAPPATSTENPSRPEKSRFPNELPAPHTSRCYPEIAPMAIAKVHEPQRVGPCGHRLEIRYE